MADLASLEVQDGLLRMIGLPTSARDEVHCTPFVVGLVLGSCEVAACVAVVVECRLSTAV